MHALRRTLMLVGVTSAAMVLADCSSSESTSSDGGSNDQGAPYADAPQSGDGSQNPDGASTTGALHWLDPLSYAKPAFVPLSVPDETAVTNKYWIDLTAGSGTTCSQSAPCGSFDDVLGKPGTTGGPAIVYVKGTGGMSWYEDTIYGSGNTDCRTAVCDHWILVRTWPAGSPGCATECTATITGNSNIASAGVHHIVFDGGPDMKIEFQSDGKTAQYANHIIADNVTIYRTRMSCVGNNQQLGWAVGDTSVANDVSFINNEFYGCASTGDQVSAVYAGPGGGGGYTNLLFQNNIVRDFFGEGIEINPRVTSTGLTITGNAFHGVGKGTCATGWGCRPGITVGIQSGGGNGSTTIADNLIWDTGSGCIWDRGGGTPAPIIANNTCYDFGKGAQSGGQPNPQGISGYTNGGTATVVNNIIYAPNGTDPLDGSSFGGSNNLCATGKTCGPAAQTWSAAAVLSTDPSTSTFLMIGPSSAAHDHGTTAQGPSVDYAGTSRLKGSGVDIGAFEY